MGSQCFDKEDAGDYGTISAAGDYEFNDVKFERVFCCLMVAAASVYWYEEGRLEQN